MRDKNRTLDMDTSAAFDTSPKPYVYGVVGAAGAAGTEHAAAGNANANLGIHGRTPSETPLMYAGQAQPAWPSSRASTSETLGANARLRTHSHAGSSLDHSAHGHIGAAALMLPSSPSPSASAGSPPGSPTGLSRDSSQQQQPRQLYVANAEPGSPISPAPATQGFGGFNAGMGESPAGPSSSAGPVPPSAYPSAPAEKARLRAQRESLDARSTMSGAMSDASHTSVQPAMQDASPGERARSPVVVHQDGGRAVSPPISPEPTSEHVNHADAPPAYAD